MADPQPLSPDDRTDLAAGRHHDPFAHLGRHRTGEGWMVRAVVPGAQSVRLVTEDARHEMCGEGDGLWEIALPTDPGAYHFDAAREGVHWRVEDAYRFGPILTAEDEYLISEGTHRRLWRVLGAQIRIHEGTPGVSFAVWAPGAQRVSLVGDFNDWDGRRHVMRWRGSSGVAEIFLPGLGEGALYKYEILGADGAVHLKADPLGFGSEHPPQNASVVRSLPEAAPAGAWASRRAEAQRRDAPIAIYEVHTPSWQRDEAGRPLDWDSLAARLIPYARDLGFTHLELMPVSEYPFDGSWGYQPIGLYAPTSRHGDPAGLRRFVDTAHDEGMGVILDWVVGHFPTDAHGLGRFDGTPLYEHADPKEGFHRDWNTLIFNYGRREVANYLTANALYWLAEYGLDGLRVDAVASMLYRDYSREEGDWVPNIHGGRENLEAIAFLQRVNTEVYAEASGVVTMAEESTAWDGVSRPVHDGGLGFGFKWNMGWMNDTLAYMSEAHEHRAWHHDKMTFGLLYAFSENFILPLSHDEVVHGKGSILGRMPGDDWQRFANLRAYYAFMWAHPGKKLLFMGSEFGQPGEWNHAGTVDWHAASQPAHAGVRDLVRDLNGVYRATPALHARDALAEGFEWVDGGAREASVLAWIRHGPEGAAPVLCVFNFSRFERADWRLGVPLPGRWTEIVNTDAERYGGSGRGNLGGVAAETVPSHGKPCSVTVTLPPLCGLMFRHEG